ncbi:CMP-N-acetylneuraminate-beta-galactosamide-alpha-2,3-sialyltransferase 2-like isoform X2 [Protopterus annectens]|nr:CMP-N-acetylneuraminate-beta-galactosamide-alpha-2,3-sialyltransferase 2-like isoform X2 [Protopterus annectens]
MTKLFEVVPNTDPYQSKNETQCRRCAIVGNSGNLKYSSYGAKIDSHDFVMRMNRATTSGFEKDVGNKSTHYFMYPESAHHLPPGVHFVLIPFKPLDMEWIVSALTTGNIKFTYVRVVSKIHLDQDKVMILNPAFLKYIHDNWTNHHGKYPSTGMIAILFALHICEEVSVFGFGADRKGSWHHYWENNKHAGAFQKTGVHDAKFEMEIIRKLVEEGKITFYNETNVKY